MAYKGENYDSINANNYHDYNIKTLEKIKNDGPGTYKFMYYFTNSEGKLRCTTLTIDYDGSNLSGMNFDGPSSNFNYGKLDNYFAEVDSSALNIYPRHYHNSHNDQYVNGVWCYHDIYGAGVHKTVVSGILSDASEVFDIDPSHALIGGTSYVGDKAAREAARYIKRQAKNGVDVNGMIVTCFEPSVKDDGGTKVQLTDEEIKILNDSNTVILDFHICDGLSLRYKHQNKGLHEYVIDVNLYSDKDHKHKLGSVHGPIYDLMLKLGYTELTSGNFDWTTLKNTKAYLDYYGCNVYPVFKITEYNADGSTNEISLRQMNDIIDAAIKSDLHFIESSISNLQGEISKMKCLNEDYSVEMSGNTDVPLCEKDIMSTLLGSVKDALDKFSKELGMILSVGEDYDKLDLQLSDEAQQLGESFRQGLDSQIFNQERYEDTYKEFEIDYDKLEEDYSSYEEESKSNGLLGGLSSIFPFLAGTNDNNQNSSFDNGFLAGYKPGEGVNQSQSTQNDVETEDKPQVDIGDRGSHAFSGPNFESNSSLEDSSLNQNDTVPSPEPGPDPHQMDDEIKPFTEEDYSGEEATVVNEESNNTNNSNGFDNRFLAGYKPGEGINESQSTQNNVETEDKPQVDIGDRGSHAFSGPNFESNSSSENSRSEEATVIVEEESSSHHSGSFENEIVSPGEEYSGEVATIIPDERDVNNDTTNNDEGIKIVFGENQDSVREGENTQNIGYNLTEERVKPVVPPVQNETVVPPIENEPVVPPVENTHPTIEDNPIIEEPTTEIEPIVENSNTENIASPVVEVVSENKIPTPEVIINQPINKPITKPIQRNTQVESVNIPEIKIPETIKEEIGKNIIEDYENIPSVIPNVPVIDIPDEPVPNETNEANSGNALKTLGTIAGIGAGIGASAFVASQFINNKTENDDHYEYEKDNNDEDEKYEEEYNEELNQFGGEK